MKKFTLQTEAGAFDYQAEALHDGVLLNPTLPTNFESTPNDERDASQEKWWGMPYILSTTVEDVEKHTRKHQEWLALNDPKFAATDIEAEVHERRNSWQQACPTGIKYEVCCLDGGAWDRPTFWGNFGTLEDALDCAKNGPVWRRKK